MRKKLLGIVFLVLSIASYTAFFLTYKKSRFSIFFIIIGCYLFVESLDKMFNLKQSINMFYDKNTQKVIMVKRLLRAIFELLVGVLIFAYSIFSYFDYRFEITRFAKFGTEAIQPIFLFVPGGIFGIVCCVIVFVKEIKEIKESKK